MDELDVERWKTEVKIGEDSAFLNPSFNDHKLNEVQCYFYTPKLCNMEFFSFFNIILYAFVSIYNKENVTNIILLIVKVWDHRNNDLQIKVAISY